jgi:predicted nucleotide-binding protein (sugar kinase/HSP70/actin superfamily)
MSDDKGLKQGGKGNVTTIQCLPFYIYICNKIKKRALRQEDISYEAVARSRC